MNDQELDTLIAAAGTPQRGEVESLPLGGSAIELRELIMTITDNETTAENDGAGRVLEHRPSTSRSASERRTRLRRRFAIVAVAAAAATAVTVGLVSTTPTSNDPARNSPNSAYADELVAIAEEAPRLLITADGWEITRAYEFGAENGELEFTNGDQTVGLHWYSGELYADYLADRANGQEALGEVQIVGYQAPVFHYPGSDRYTALWTDGDHFVELDGTQSSEADFRALAATVETVDVETWLDAMPDSVITPTERDAALVDVTTGIVVPRGFDETLWASEGVTDRYQLGAQVTGAAACAWLDIWLAGDASGDQAAMTQAAEAMATSKTWPILLEMDAAGDYSEVIWETADAMSAGGIDVFGGDIRDPEFKMLLGCSA